MGIFQNEGYVPTERIVVFWVPLAWETGTYHMGHNLKLLMPSLGTPRILYTHLDKSPFKGLRL